MCVWKLLVKDNGGKLGYARKDTRWMTSSEELANTLQTVCPGAHRHVHLIGGDRPAIAAKYTPQLVKELLNGFICQLKKDGD